MSSPSMHSKIPGSGSHNPVDLPTSRLPLVSTSSAFEELARPVLQQLATHMVGFVSLVRIDDHETSYPIQVSRFGGENVKRADKQELDTIKTATGRLLYTLTIIGSPQRFQSAMEKVPGTTTIRDGVVRLVYDGSTPGILGVEKNTGVIAAVLLPKDGTLPKYAVEVCLRCRNFNELMARSSVDYVTDQVVEAARKIFT